jgi:hypothetical protein
MATNAVDQMRWHPHRTALGRGVVGLTDGELHYVTRRDRAAFGKSNQQVH